MHALSLQVLELVEGGIGSITGFVRLDLFPDFGLPQTLKGGDDIQDDADRDARPAYVRLPV